jgi:hypothetical protein
VEKAELEYSTDQLKIVKIEVDPNPELVEEYQVGRCTLTPPDPQLKGAWYPGGFNPRTFK